jgi:Clp amino terminal domain, pathogenicity island component
MAISRPLERVTERALQVMVLAQEEARILKHNYIGTEHILLGLLREEEGLAARVLESLDITVERVRAQVVRILGSGEEVTSGQIPFAPHAKWVLELALREALSRGHNYIGTEHILLGLVREDEGVAARDRILLDFDAEKVRNEVIRAMSGPGYERDPWPPKWGMHEERKARLSAEASSVGLPARRAGFAPAPTPASFAQTLARALEQAATQAGDRPLDAGDLIIALLEQPDWLISSALDEAGVEVGALRAAIEAARLSGE